MPTRPPRPPAPPQIESRTWNSIDEVKRAQAKLTRRITELEKLDVEDALQNHTGADQIVVSNVRNTIREVFGHNSPEYIEHQDIELWAGVLQVGMSEFAIANGVERGRVQMIGILNGLIERLQEKADELVQDGTPPPGAFLQYLNLHPRISDVASELFENGHHWEAVFAASKALVNYVKEESGRHDLDGAGLMRLVFSRNNPILKFNDLADQTEQDEQEGMMHLFEGVVLGIRNPGGHSFPEGPEQRAVEYLSLISLLAYRTQEARRK